MPAGGQQKASDGGCSKLNGDGDQQDQVDNSTLRDQVLTLFQKGDASTLLALISGPTSPLAEKTDDAAPWDPLLLWVRPRHCCLQVLAAQVKHAGLSAVASVGCGTGLLEWLIHSLTGLSVIGYEVNSDWWTSKYSPPTFIPLIYVDPDASPPYVPPTHALMCCYFNNGQVFRQYVAAYEGPLLLIIGPRDGSYHTDPLPLDYMHIHPWSLTLTHHISERDILACYIRDHVKEEVHRRLRL